MVTDGYTILIGGDLSVNPGYIAPMETLRLENAKLVVRRCIGGRVAEEEIETRTTDQLIALADEIVHQRTVLRRTGPC